MRARFQSGTFADISMLGDALGWDIGFCQLDPGAASCHARVLAAPDMVICEPLFDGRYHQLGTPPGDVATFGIPIRALDRWFDQPYATGSILPFNQAGGIDGFSLRGFRAYTLSVDRSLLERVAETVGLDVPRLIFEPESTEVISDSPAARYLRALLHHTMEIAHQGNSPTWCEDITLALLQAAQTTSAHRDLSSGSQRSQALRLAIDYVDSIEQEILSVAQLCEAVGVSVRTLNRAFNDRFAMGPKAYLARRRLSGIRRDLLKAEPDDLVSDLANQWGIWHMGQFARDYRQMFGELPSQTLAT
ncbi:MAG: helix-turn-helix domain-containing protein [Pseudomonadota bacterium]